MIAEILAPALLVGAGASAGAFMGAHRAGRHRRALEHIAELERENRRLDAEIAAAEAPPALGSAAQASYLAGRFAADQHPLSGGTNRKPERHVPVLDEEYFERKRAQWSAVPYVVYYSASAWPRGGGTSFGYTMAEAEEAFRRMGLARIRWPRG